MDAEDLCILCFYDCVFVCCCKGVCVLLGGCLCVFIRVYVCVVPGGVLEQNKLPSHTPP